MSASAKVPEVPREELGAYRTSLTFCFFNAFNWQVALGTPMVLLAEELGASPFQAGLAWAFVLLLVPVQVLATPLLAKWGFRKTMLAGWGSRAMFILPPIGIAAAGYVGMREPWMIWALIGSVFFYTLLRALGSGAWMPWILQIIPKPIRGRYFAMEQVLGGIASVITLIGSAVLFKVLDIWIAFMVQYAIAFLSAMISWLCIKRMPDAPAPAMTGLGKVVRQTPTLLLRTPQYSHFLWACCVYSALTSGIVPFCAYYLRNQLQMGGDDILLYETMRNAGTIVGSLLLRGEIDRIGPRPFFMAATIFLGAVSTFWISALVLGFAVGGYLPITYLLLGIGGAAWIAASLSHLPRVAPVADRSVAFALHGAAASFAGGVATTLWGAALRTETEGRPAMQVAVFMLFFSVVLVGVLVLTLWLRRLRYDRTEHVPSIEGGAALLRPARAFTYFVTLVDESLRPFDPREQAAKPTGEEARKN